MQLIILCKIEFKAHNSFIIVIFKLEILFYKMAPKLKKMDTWTIIFLIMIFIGSAGGVLFSVKQLFKAESNKTEIINTLKSENKLLKNNLAELKSDYDTLQNDLEKRDKIVNEQQNKIQIQNDEMKILNNKINEKSEFIQKTLFGDGYAYIELSDLAQKGAAVNILFAIQNNFEFPIYNFTASIHDFDIIYDSITELNSEKTLSFSNLAKARLLEIKLPEINPEFKETLGNKPVDYNKTKRYYIKLNQRNGNYWERILFKIIDKKLYFGIQVLEGNKIIHEHYNIPPENKKELLTELNKITLSKIVLSD